MPNEQEGTDAFSSSEIAVWHNQSKIFGGHISLRSYRPPNTYTTVRVKLRSAMLVSGVVKKIIVCLYSLILVHEFPLDKPFNAVAISSLLARGFDTLYKRCVPTGGSV